MDADLPRYITTAYQIRISCESGIKPELVVGTIWDRRLMDLWEIPEEERKDCEGNVLSKEDFPDLHAVLRGMFGEDAKTFNLPDMRGRIVDDGR